MNIFYRFIFFTCMAFAWVTLSAQVDSLRFSTGEYVLGEVKHMKRGILTVETDYSDSDFTIEWKKVIGIFTRTEFLINLSNGDTHFGSIESLGESKIRIRSDENDSLVVEQNDIVYLNAYEDKFLDRLSASISLGFDMTKANNFKQFMTRSSIAYSAEKWQSGASVYALRSTQDQVEDIQRTEADLSFSYLLPYRFFGVATLSYLSNTEQSIESRINAHLGAGRFFVQSNRMFWGMKLGLNRNIERYLNDTGDRESWEGFLGTELNLFDIGDLNLLLSVLVYPGITDSGRLRSDSKFDIKYDLPLDFFIKMGVSLNYDNKPAEGASTTDYVFGISVGWEW